MPKGLLVAGVTIAGFLGLSASPLARDGDGLPDRWERRYGLSTSSGSASGDPDRDRLTNRSEYRRRTNPRRADTDRDRLRDGAEVRRYRTNPRRADTDGDGYSDGLEVRSGTNPRDAASRPAGAPDVAGGPGAPVAPAVPPAALAPRGFPNPATAGVPAGWTPAQTRTTDLHLTQPGAVVQDVLLVGADIIVEAPNVTIRRTKLQGGRISNFNGSPCRSGMVIEDTTLEPPPGASSIVENEGAVDVGGYTARRVKIWRRAEGFRAGADCGQIRIEDSFAKIVIPSGRCDLHSDGIQGYGGPWTTVVNTTIDFKEAGCGTAPFFFPRNQGNTGVTVDRLLLTGGGYPFRLGVGGTVSGLKIVDDSWGYGPINVRCSLVTAWDAAIVKITDDYQVSRTVRSQPCNTEDGS